jgi:hypothetical protein
VVQLVAQKLTNVTFPRNCEVLVCEPSSKTKLDSGATCEEQAINPQASRVSHREMNFKNVVTIRENFQ